MATTSNQSRLRTVREARSMPLRMASSMLSGLVPTISDRPYVWLGTWGPLGFLLDPVDLEPHPLCSAVHGVGVARGQCQCEQWRRRTDLRVGAEPDVTVQLVKALEHLGDPVLL